MVSRRPPIGVVGIWEAFRDAPVSGVDRRASLKNTEFPFSEKIAKVEENNDKHDVENKETQGGPGLVGDGLVVMLVSYFGSDVVDENKEQIEHYYEENHPVEKAKSSGEELNEEEQNRHIIGHNLQYFILIQLVGLLSGEVNPEVNESNPGSRPGEMVAD